MAKKPARPDAPDRDVNIHIDDDDDAAALNDLRLAVRRLDAKLVTLTRQGVALMAESAEIRAFHDRVMPTIANLGGLITDLRARLAQGGGTSPEDQVLLGNVAGALEAVATAAQPPA